MPLDKYDLVAINYIDDYKDLAKEIYKAGLKRGYEKGVYKASIQLKQECVLKQFGDCSYNETGCSDCVIKNNIKAAMSAQGLLVF